jgi:uncharacterized protein (DUF433 family)
MAVQEFTAAEASWVTGLSVKAINKAIEDAAVPVRTVRAGKLRRRYVPYTSLVCLQLHAEGLNRLPLRVRREVFRRVLRQPQQKQLRYTEALIVDVERATTKMRTRVKELERAASMIHADPEIMAGTPVFRGTRVPVYVIAELLDRGTPLKEIVEGYPSITEEMVNYARVYAVTHAKRGRPPLQPWSGRRPFKRQKSKLSRVS